MGDINEMVRRKSDKDDLIQDKSEEMQVKRWRERIDTSIRYQKAVSEEKGWKSLIDKYKGKWDIPSAGKVKVPPINDIFAFIDTDLAILSSNNPYISVNARKVTTVGSAALQEVALNHEWRELRIKESTDRGLVETNLVGHSWHKTGTSIEVEGTGEQMKLTGERMFSSHAPWEDIVFNVGAKNPPWDCQWIAQRITSPLEDVKSKYKGKVSGIKGTVHPRFNKDGRTDSDTDKMQFPDDIRFSVLWEIWDARSRKIYLISDETNSKKFLRTNNWPPYLDEFPHRMLWFYDALDEPYPLSGVSMWVDQVTEKSKMLAMILKHAKRWNRQMIGKAGTLSQAELEKFMDGEDGAFIEHQSSGKIRDDIMFADYGQMSSDHYRIIALTDSIMRNIHGQPGIERGAETPTSSRTIGELELIQTGARGRSQRRVGKFEAHLTNIARDLLANIKGRFNVERIAKVVQETPDEIREILKDKIDPRTGEVKYSDEDIKGETDVFIAPGSTMKLDRQGRLRILERVLELTTRFQGVVPEFLKQIIMEMLRDFDLPQLEEAFKLDQIRAIQAAKAASQVRQIDNFKTLAEGQKREAQAEQITAETAEIERKTSLPLALRMALEGKGGKE